VSYIVDMPYSLGFNYTNLSTLGLVITVQSSKESSKTFATPSALRISGAVYIVVRLKV
jgi:hypothetical protein